MEAAARRLPVTISTRMSLKGAVMCVTKNKTRYTTMETRERTTP
jgi:hypothetical protein